MCRHSTSCVCFLELKSADFAVYDVNWHNFYDQKKFHNRTDTRLRILSQDKEVDSNKTFLILSC